MAIKEWIKITAEAAKAALKMTAKDLQEMSGAELSSLDNKQLKGALRTIQKATSQRKRRLEKAGVHSKALEGFLERGLIKTDLKSQAAMRAELKRGIAFLNSKTSLVTGARRDVAQSRADLGLSPDADTDTVKRGWDLFHKIQEEYGSTIVNQQAGKYKTQQKYVGKAIEQGQTDEEILQHFQEVYESFQEKEAAELADIENGFAM